MSKWKTRVQCIKLKNINYSQNSILKKKRKDVNGEKFTNFERYLLLVSVKIILKYYIMVYM